MHYPSRYESIQQGHAPAYEHYKHTLMCKCARIAGKSRTQATEYTNHTHQRHRYDPFKKPKSRGNAGFRARDKKLDKIRKELEKIY